MDDFNIEDCTHEVQFNNLCAVCGKNLEHTDDQTAQVDITHNRPGLTVSRKEAERLEQEDATRLLKERKLILVVDLDQTIVHATWDPTVGEWMADENNANHEATKDIRQFKLPESTMVYYLKLRPGTAEFLKKLSDIYELHVYTMGTRQYADAVVNEIDPDHTIFQDRIMSRDENDRKSKSENRSSTKKSLDRLFSSDKSMVAIIDDRLDVWDYSPHLVHIKPYVFFKGTGDINSPFANKKESLDQKQSTEGEKDGVDGNKEKDIETVLETQKKEQDAMAKQQQEERPLAQKQRELGASQQPVLVDDDKVLYEKLEVFMQIHERFYAAYDKKIQQMQSNNISISNPFTTIPNIVDCINPFRNHILANVHILFSGMIKLDVDPKSSHWWKTAEAYGATCHLNLSSKITHLIAAKAGTSKTNEANKQYPHIHVVNPNWLIDSIYHEGAQDESLYRHSSGGGPSAPLGGLNENDDDDVANPESTPLDLEDGAFDNKQLDLKDVDWNDADDEVNEFLSDDSDNDDDDDDVDDNDNDDNGTTPSSSQQSPIEASTKKRKRDEELDSESDEIQQDKTEKQKLNEATTTAALREDGYSSGEDGYGSGYSDDGNNNNDGHSDSDKNDDYGDEDDDDEYSDMDDFAELLDEAMD
ncbi:hypothetical protein BC941DRAFT_385470 [Chlamydoabsidia padenii]|nr:hypothetical protein BC941DRAFT_385470 [Chlamydoabsidia padenii]